MVLFTFNKRYREFAVNRLRSKGIQYLLMPVGNDRFNLFSASPNAWRPSA